MAAAPLAVFGEVRHPRPDTGSACAGEGSGLALWWAAALWGSSGAAAVEGLVLYRAIHRVKDFPWRKEGEAAFAAHLASVVIRVVLGGGLAAAFGASAQVAGPLGALAAGIAAPKTVVSGRAWPTRQWNPCRRQPRARPRRRPKLPRKEVPVRPDSFGSQLCAAPARTTPAFQKAPRPARTGFLNQLAGALARGHPRIPQRPGHRAAAPPGRFSCGPTRA